MNDYAKKIAANKEEIQAFKTSKVWEIWLEYAKWKKADFKNKAITAETVEKREYARMSYMAFEQFENIPFDMVREAETISQETAPANS